MTIDARAKAAAEALRQSVVNIHPSSAPAPKRRVAVLVMAGTVLAGAVGVSALLASRHQTAIRVGPVIGFGSTTLPSAAAPPSVEGSCRGNVARMEIAGLAYGDHVPLGDALTNFGVPSTVVDFRGVTDLGPDETSAAEHLPEPDRVVKLDRVRALRGAMPTGTTFLASTYEIADARAELRGGAQLLALLGPATPPDGKPVVRVAVAVRPDGSAALLGDCIPHWNTALVAYASRVALQPGAVIRALLLDPTGATAKAFLASAEAQVLAGP
jgi:hypothetical protein